MKLPRDISGLDLANALGRLGYVVSHQTGSHIRLTTQRGGVHHLTIPAHHCIRVGTLSAILRDVAQHHQLSRQQLLEESVRVTTKVFHAELYGTRESKYERLAESDVSTTPWTEPQPSAPF